MFYNVAEGTGALDDTWRRKGYFPVALGIVKAQY